VYEYDYSNDENEQTSHSNNTRKFSAADITALFLGLAAVAVLLGVEELFSTTNTSMFTSHHKYQYQMNLLFFSICQYVEARFLRHTTNWYLKI
jgi:hypothetical protein